MRAWLGKGYGGFREDIRVHLRPLLWGSQPEIDIEGIEFCRELPAKEVAPVLPVITHGDISRIIYGGMVVKPSLELCPGTWLHLQRLCRFGRAKPPANRGA